MQWSSRNYTTTSSVDTWVNQTYYAGLGNSEGIDLRIEMNRILYGGVGRRPKGHWIVLRQYDRTSRSEYYNTRTHEGVGGPAFTYTDSVLRTRRVPVSRRSEKIEDLKVGGNVLDGYVYYLEYHINPRIGDDIFELELADHTNYPGSASTLTLQEKFRVKRVHPWRLDNGNIIYWMALSEFEDIRH